MSMLDDSESIKSQEIRKQLNIDKLNEKELLKYKVDFLTKHMGYEYLSNIEKNDYFNELIK